MFSIQRLLGKEDKFFDLLEASAEEARSSVDALISLTRLPAVERSLDQVASVRRKDKRITQEISELLCRTFVTALEREDIESLSIVLYKIPKTIEKFMERVMIAGPSVGQVDFSPHTQMLQEATETLLHMIRDLRRGSPLPKMKAHNDKLQKIESDADELILSTYRSLFSGKYPPLEVILLKDLYELLEKVVDRCRDAGNVILQIVLKNS